MVARGSVELFWHHKEAAILYLNNPQARNAISKNMMTQLKQVTEVLANRPPIFIVLTAKDGRSFCAGGDLKDVRENLMSTEAAAAKHQQMSATLSRLSSLPSFLIAAQEGAAVGGGAELITYCDRIVSAKHSRIGFVHASLGVSPGWGGGAQLLGKVGRNAALQFLISAKMWHVEECLRVGLVDRIVESGQALPEVLSEVDRYLKYPHDSLRGILNLVKGGGVEKDIFLSLWGKEAHRRALGLN